MQVKLKNSKFIIGLVCLLIVALALPYSSVSAQAEGSDNTLASVQSTIKMCYTVAKEAEATGANITSLQEILNAAGSLLSKAELSNAQNDFASANDYAEQAQNLLTDFVPKANSLRDSASYQQQSRFMSNIIGLIVGASVIIGASITLWIYLSRQDPAKRASFERFKALFFVVPLILMLLVASPIMQRFLVYPQNDRFTEFWLLGTDQKAENYPYDIAKNTDYRIFLGLSNHLGSISYYRVQVKLFNQSLDDGPDTFKRTHSNLPTLYNFNVFVAADQNVHLPIIFSFDYDLLDPELNFNSLTLCDDDVDIGDYISLPDSISWDYYACLVFELWLYNGSTGNFQYHERYLSLRLNMTSPI
ncbi:DUF1616 domain-containing protein [Candidatus Bathycorpusculum sp.]|uniref:DUF1616 domain-containing protein n=1 Tax=Candidatus Bathycorpusculum sp. TaxID=2994959 RepID=UPI0028351AAA|nr:DUF1616 domain-containing protein [Candidatus Termitimicrobium sp.]